MRGVQTPLLNPSTNRKKQKGPPVTLVSLEKIEDPHFYHAKKSNFLTFYLYILYIYIYLYIKTKHIVI